MVKHYVLLGTCTHGIHLKEGLGSLRLFIWICQFGIKERGKKKTKGFDLGVSTKIGLISILCFQVEVIHFRQEVFIRIGEKFWWTTKSHKFVKLIKSRLTLYNLVWNSGLNLCLMVCIGCCFCIMVWNSGCVN